MAECKRLIWNKPHFFLLGMLLILNIIFIGMQCNENRKITLSGDALQHYLEGYPFYVNQTLENAKTMQSLSLLGNQESYVARNVEKTVMDFSKLTDIKPLEGENSGIIVWKGFEMADFFCLGYGIFFILQFASEHKKGLTLLIYSTEGGRVKLCFQRIMILAAALFFGCFCIYGSSFLTVCMHYGDAGLIRPLQSLPEFQKCALRITVGQYVCCSFLLKYVTILVLILLYFAFVGIFRNGLATFCFGGGIVTEYLLYHWIRSASIWNGWKYMNLYSMLRGSDAFAVYYNLNIRNHPIAVLTLQIAMAGVFLGVSIILSVWGHCRKRREGGSAIFLLQERIKAFCERHKPVLPSFLWEGKKILFSQKGLLILAVIFYLAFSSASQTEYRDFRNRMQMEYYAVYGGELTEEKIDTLLKLEKKMTKYHDNALRNIDKINKKIEEYTAQGLEVPSQWNASVQDSEMAVREYEAKLNGIRPIVQNALSAREYEERTGRHVSLLEPFAYEMLFRDDMQTYRNSRLYCLICMVLVFSGVMCCEKTSHMEELMHTLYGGRKRVVIHKIIWVSILAVLFSLPIYLIQYVQIGKIFPFQNQGDIVQSLEILRSFPIAMSIRMYLFCFYLRRVGLSVLLGLGVLGIGSKCKSRISVLAICGCLLLIPLLVSEFWGIPACL